MEPRYLALADGRQVAVEFDDDMQVCVHANGVKIGNLDHREVGERYDIRLITNIYLEGPDRSGAYKRCGIMKQVLRWLVEEFEFCMLARPHDGATQLDGSHLTSDAAAFFDRMESYGLVGRYGERHDISDNLP